MIWFSAGWAMMCQARRVAQGSRSSHLLALLGTRAIPMQRLSCLQVAPFSKVYTPLSGILPLRTQRPDVGISFLGVCSVEYHEARA
jgi:hypothetical protein